MLFYLIIYFIYLIYKSRSAFYMLQQNLYNENNRYLKWIIRNYKKCFNVIDFIPLIFYIFTFLSNETFILKTVYLTSAFIYLFGIYNEYKNNQTSQNKIEFKITGRIKRLYFTELVIFTILLYILLKYQIPFILLALGILISFNYVFIYLLNIINIVFEKLIYLYYLNKAKRKLKKSTRLNVVAITGSYGKTSTKNILNSILSSEYISLKTPKNLNTPYGLMITINNYLDVFTDIFIAEMGAYVGGEIKKMCHLVKPKYAIVTTIGNAHLETFGTKEKICKAKFELVENLEPDGIAVLNKDDSYQVNYVKNNLKNKVKIIWVGINNKNADYNAVNIKTLKNGTSFDIIHNNQSYSFTTSLLGIHNVYNILYSVALGNYLKINFNDMIREVRGLKAVEHRLELKKMNDIMMIDDSYNSNPIGAKNAIDVLKLMNGVKVVVTPGMIELGDKEDKLNYDFGTLIAKCADYVILIGEKRTINIKNGILDNGFDQNKIIILNRVKDAYNELVKIKLENGNKEVFALFENDLPDIYSEGGN